ncbi:hypothetical protein Ciccas_005292 [Cichlidogyrus casuarinus]|uniref:BACK domain-containing protein n=1 Tax=Cichlidogyrus casuarinus TaxID=1844966 RepID=A0ABD2Q922_9PLAT
MHYSIKRTDLVELRKQSPYFEMLHKYHPRGCELQLPQFLAVGFQSVMDFIRTGRYEISMDNVCECFITADYLLVEPMRQACVNYLDRQLDVEPASALILWIKSRHLVWPELGQMAFIKVLQNFESIARTAKFLNLSVEDLISLLESSQISFSKELSSVADRVKVWLNLDQIHKVCSARTLLNTIPLHILTKEECQCLEIYAHMRDRAFYSEFRSIWPLTNTAQLFALP